MTKNKNLLALSILIVIVAVFYFINKKAVAPALVGQNTGEQKEVCYFKATTDGGITDNAFTSINYDAGGKVHGIINFIPEEKDSLVGTYTGVIEKSDVAGYPTRLNIIYSGWGEGTLSKQQEIIIVGASDIKTGTGAMDDKMTDGVWKIKDLNNLSYNNALPLVDCASVPDRVKKDYSEQASATTSQSQIYENQYMKIIIPDGWTAKQANRTVYYGTCVNKQNCVTTPKIEPNPPAVNITKGKYILYINTQASQASGAEGGRFAEIAMGAPSVDAVIKDQPSPICGISETNPALTDHPRVDLYVGPQDNSKDTPWCTVPTNGSTVWYFSYITDKNKSYFNYYNKPNEALGFVVTMAYNSKDENSFPLKGSTELNSMLAEMTGIAKSLEIKQQ